MGKHREEVKKQREKEEEEKKKVKKGVKKISVPDIEDFNPKDYEELLIDKEQSMVQDIAVDFEKLIEEMEILYGSSYHKVHGEETKAQMNFDKWRDFNIPKMWPALPFNLKGKF